MTDAVVSELVNQGKITDPHSAKGRLMLEAAHLFKSKGYERTTVRELAKAVGIQSGSLFHHFKSKEDILLGVMKETIIVNIGRMNQALTQQPDPKHQLLALIRCELDSVHLDTGEAMSVLVSEWRSLSEAHQKYILKLRDDYEALWFSVIREGIADGAIKHDAFILRRLIAGAISWSSTWYRPDGDLSLDELANQTLMLAIQS